MRNFFQRLSAFMMGRNGIDRLNLFLLALVVTIGIVNIFVFNRIASLIVYGCQLAVMGLIVFRVLSQNITKRSAENRRYMKMRDAVVNFFTLNNRKFKERKEYKYIKCPHCKAQLRVKNKKGMHTVRCPRCGEQFKKKI